MMVRQIQTLGIRLTLVTSFSFLCLLLFFVVFAMHYSVCETLSLKWQLLNSGVLYRRKHFSVCFIRYTNESMQIERNEFELKKRTE